MIIELSGLKQQDWFVWELRVDNNQTVNVENVRYYLEEYKNLFDLLASLNEQIAKDDENIDYNAFAIEHQRQLISVQQSQNNIDKIFTKSHSIGEDLKHVIHERDIIIERINEQEDILKQLVILELENTKVELTKLQKSKNVLSKYQIPLEQEARFVDKVK